MIPVLISLAKNKILQVVSWFKKYYKIIAVIVISILTAILFY
jgi:hydroxymethylpyrimidine pyrophosphatase-like HAD family hydrolase